MVGTSACGRGLTHHGLLHSPSADLAAILAPLIAERLTQEETVLAALPADITEKLPALLPTLAGLHVTDSSELFRHPGRVLAYYRAWLAETRSDGRPAAIVAVPDPGDNDQHRAALWMHIDAATTVALAEYDNLTLICAYPDCPAAADAVRRVHPSLVNGTIIPNPDHLPAEQFVARYPLPPPAELGRPELIHNIEHLTQLSPLRQIVSAHASGAGLPAARCDDVVLAVTEVASNALEHGAPPATVRLWTTSSSMICQVTDAGRYTEPLAGLLPPPSTQYRGRGLWMVHQLCDQFYLWQHPTTVRVQMDRTPGIAS
ncbi:MAG TPA: ATP-binding protein [Pseudonocardiaceae bacterium]|nr:ATP-binding protein [Pseudonocardiaceae bacterium]